MPGLPVDDAPAAWFVRAVAAQHVAAVVLRFADIPLRGPEHVARDFLVAAVFKNVFCILHRHPPQNQPRRFERRHGEKTVFVRGKHVLDSLR